MVVQPLYIRWLTCSAEPQRDVRLVRGGIEIQVELVLPKVDEKL